MMGEQGKYVRTHVHTQVAIEYFSRFTLVVAVVMNARLLLT